MGLRALHDSGELQTRGILTPQWTPTDFDLDEDTRVLLWVMEHRDAKFEALHKRGPGGKFATMAARIAKALAAHHGGDTADPLKDFNREQLRRVAKARGIKLKPNASEDDIKKALINHHAAGKKKSAPPEKAAVPTPAKAPKPPENPESIAKLIKTMSKGPDVVAELKGLDEQQLAAVAKAGGWRLLPGMSRHDMIGDIAFYITRDPDPFGGVQLDPMPEAAAHHGHVAGTDLFSGDAAATLAKKLAADGRSSDSSDVLLRKVAHAQGFDGKPRVVSSTEMDALVAAGHREAYRGVQDTASHTSQQLHDRLRDGDVWYGTGIYGNGIYAGTRTEADQWAGYGGAAGSVVRMALDPRAKVADWSTLRADFLRDTSNLEPSIRGVFSDPGRYAAALGYDAIDAPNNELIILNRTAIAVEET